MKDTYWMALGGFCLIGLAAWIGTVVGKSRGERLLREGRLGKSKSIWTRDLFETRVGRMVATIVLFPLSVIAGTRAIIEQHASWQYFSYHGFDAICIGVGEIGIGIVTLSAYGFPKRSHGEAGIRTLGIWSGTICFVLGFSIALFRNI